ncbi:two-component system, OmpR family, sensor histidine kinase TctE [Novimethylophilus kurashikiensis]|uniref:histidine kinase n=1 Tax=Novimethylophilus kurashikiensis TaxID=1825523 RepID=A0A2R5FBS2_9PROT|nr:two-component system, OmpR family, sensor histidine kinase TctE [Novimethylophilus kurashikiensis]
MGAVVAYLFALRAATDAYDLGLLDDALDLDKQVSLHQGGLALELPPAARQMLASNNEDRVRYAAWDEQGRMFSGDAGLKQLDIPQGEENHVFQDVQLQDGASRAVVLRGSLYGRTIFVAVAQTVHGRNRLTRNIFFKLLFPEALLAVVAMSIVLLGVRRGLSPVNALSEEILKRSPQDLSRIDENRAPAELQPIIHGVNELLEKLSASFAGHRRFIADAAHQLRTPLAVLGSQIEVGLQQPPQNVRALLQQLLATTNRTSHLANQLLSMARLEHTEQDVFTHGPVELSEVVRAAAADFIGRAADKNLDLEFRLVPCTVQGNALLLRELIMNLLDNAVRYTPEDGHVWLTLEQEGKQCALAVNDSGPGVPESALTTLGKPFHRLASDESGCGLGLAIVREIARLHQAEVMFGRSSEGGLSVRIVLNALPTSRT